MTSNTELKWIYNSIFILQALHLFSTAYVFITESVKTNWESSTNWLIVHYPAVYARSAVIYNRWKIVKCHINYFVNTQILGKCCEPLDVEWTNIARLTRDLTGEYNLNENYQIYKGDQILDTVNDITITNSRNYLSPLQIVKSADSYWVAGLGPHEYTNVASKTRFLTISYSHPDLEKILYLEIPKSYYMVGNHLFSDTFILRHLTYHHSDFVFDDRYTIILIDNNINRVELKMGDYCVLTKTGYELIQTSSKKSD